MRDTLHGRVVMRRPVVEMARTLGRNPVVEGQAPVDGGPATPVDENARARGLHPETVPSRDVNAQRGGAGWATARDRFPGRVDRASASRGDGTAGHRDPVVNRRATSPDPRPQARVSAVSPAAVPATADGILVAAAGPDPRRQRACARSPGVAPPRRSSATREWRTRAAAGPDPRRACARAPRAARYQGDGAHAVSATASIAIAVTAAQ